MTTLKQEIIEFIKLEKLINIETEKFQIALELERTEEVDRLNKRIDLLESKLKNQVALGCRLLKMEVCQFLFEVEQYEQKQN